MVALAKLSKKKTQTTVSIAPATLKKIHWLRDRWRAGTVTNTITRMADEAVEQVAAPKFTRG